jgi:hypothetical protein
MSNLWQKISPAIPADSLLQYNHETHLRTLADEVHRIARQGLCLLQRPERNRRDRQPGHRTRRTGLRHRQPLPVHERTHHGGGEHTPAVAGRPGRGDAGRDDGTGDTVHPRAAQGLPSAGIQRGSEHRRGGRSRRGRTRAPAHRAALGRGREFHVHGGGDARPARVAGGNVEAGAGELGRGLARINAESQSPGD